MTTALAETTSYPLTDNRRWGREARWSYVAQEIARDMLEIPDILKNAGIDDAEWHVMTNSRGFQEMLKENIATWRSSLNVRERIEVRQLYMIENTLPELYRALHDPEFAHTAKVELFKALARNVGIGVKEPGAPVATGERISISINMGDPDKKVEVRNVTPEVMRPEPVILEGTVIPQPAIPFPNVEISIDD